jgi:hypothetical protein
MLDVFNSALFSVVSLTDAINKPIFQPGRIGQMGLFSERGVTTLTVVVEEKDGQLTLVSPSPRGSAGQTLDKIKPKGRPFVIPHFQIDDAIYADEVQGIRAWGTESELETVQGRVAERMMIHRASHEVTLEYARVGAVIGVITYADGSTTDLFTEFGVVQDAEVDWDLDNAAPVAGILRKRAAATIRLMSTNLGGLPFFGVHAMTGDAFYDDLLAHVEVRNTFLNNPTAAELRRSYVVNGQSYGSFEFGGITFENYRGAVGGTTFINTDKAHFFPLGVPNLFRTYFAPADYIETVNTVGKMLYAKQYEMPNGKGINMEVQMNQLSICTRPKALLKGRRT